jgi:hypothetical protein
MFFGRYYAVKAGILYLLLEHILRLIILILLVFISLSIHHQPNGSGYGILLGLMLVPVTIIGTFFSILVAAGVAMRSKYWLSDATISTSQSQR